MNSRIFTAGFYGGLHLLYLHLMGEAETSDIGRYIIPFHVYASFYSLYVIL